MFNKKRPIDELVKDSYNRWSKSYVFIKKTRVRTLYSVFILVFLTAAAAATIWSVSTDIHQSSRAATNNGQSAKCANYLKVAKRYQDIARQYCAKAKKSKKYKSQCEYNTNQANRNMELYNSNCKKSACSDSDNGKNYTVAGTVNGKPGPMFEKNTASDTCPQEGVLREYSLDSNCSIQYEDVNCQCVNGACAKSEYGGRCVNDSMCSSGDMCKPSGRYPEMEKFCCKANECASVIPGTDPVNTVAGVFNCVGTGGHDEAMSPVPTNLICDNGQWIVSTSTSPNCPPGASCPPDLYDAANNTATTTDYDFWLACYRKEATGDCAKADFDGNKLIGLEDFAALRLARDKYDLNGDRVVNMKATDTISTSDYAYWRFCYRKEAAGDCAKADFDGNKLVGLEDFAALKLAVSQHDLNGDGVISMGTK